MRLPCVIGSVFGTHGVLEGDRVLPDCTGWKELLVSWVPQLVSAPGLPKGVNPATLQCHDLFIYHLNMATIVWLHHL